MHRNIFNLLPDGPSRDLLAVHNTCTAFRRAVVDGGNLQHRHQGALQRRHLAAQQMAQLAGLVSKAVSQATTRDRAAQCVPLLPLLNPKQQGKLMDVVLNERNYGGSAYWNRDNSRNHDNSIDWARVRAGHVGDMVPSLAYLDETLQTRLVQTVIGFPDGKRAAEVICRFGTELAHLSEALRGDLVGKAISLADAFDRAAAIAGLGPGLASLNPGQQQQLLEATLAMQVFPKAKATEGLCKGLKHLGAVQRELLFNDVINTVPSWLMAPAIENLGRSLECLSLDQRDMLVRVTIHMISDAAPDSQFFAPQALEGLAEGLQYLTAHQRDTLIRESMTQRTGWDRSRAIYALAAGLASMTPEQRHQLLDAVDRLGSSSAKAYAIVNFIAGWASLDSAWKGRVVSMTTGLENCSGKADAIAALGARLGDLEHEQHSALVQAAIDILRTDAGFGAEMKRTVGAGLGVGLGNLHLDLRTDLVNTVSRELPTDEERSRASAAAAIAGLGAGRPHLNEAQYNALIAAATRLQSRSGWGPFRTTDHSAIIAFAAEAAKALAPDGRPKPAPALRG